MRVTVLPSLLAPVREGSCFGGAEVAALALAEGLAERAHEVSLIGLEGSGGRRLSTVIAPTGTPIFRPGGEAAVGDENVDPFPRIFDGLEARAADGQLDVLHLHLIDPEALVRADGLARAFPRVRVVSTLHLAAIFPETVRVVQALLRERSPVTFSAPSLFAARSYGPGSERIVVVPNGVDARDLPHGVRPASDRLAWAGRRSREKGLDSALEIARRARRSLIIAGPLPPEGGAVPLPADVAVEDRGFLPRRRVAEELFAGALATLVTSAIAESHSLVALESFAVGTPVVAFDVGAIREVVEDGVTGFVVPAGDVEAAVRAVDAIGAQAIDRARCRREALERFDHGRTIERFEAIYGLAPV